MEISANTMRNHRDLLRVNIGAGGVVRKNRIAAISQWMRQKQNKSGEILKSVIDCKIPDNNRLNGA